MSPDNTLTRYYENWYIDMYIEDLVYYNSAPNCLFDEHHGIVYFKSINEVVVGLSYIPAFKIESLKDDVLVIKANLGTFNFGTSGYDYNSYSLHVLHPASPERTEYFNSAIHCSEIKR